MASRLPRLAKRRRLAAAARQSLDQRSFDLFEPLRRRLARIIGIVDPKPVEHQSVGQRVNLCRADLQADAAQAPR